MTAITVAQIGATLHQDFDSYFQQPLLRVACRSVDVGSDFKFAKMPKVL